MPTQLISFNDFTSGNRVYSDGFDADYVIAATAMFGSSDGMAIRLSSSSHDVFVRGTVMGDVIGIEMGNDRSADYGNSIHLSEGGAVLGHEGVRTFGGATVINAGEILGSYAALQMNASGIRASVLQNDGRISAGQIAVKVDAEDASTFSLMNRGLIAAESCAVRVSGYAETTSGKFVNHGIVQGAWAYLGGTGEERVVNRGQMVGQVDLGWGNDRFDNRGGTVEGSVGGSGGDDLFLPGLADENFDGGGGIDTLDFRGSAGLRVSLMDDSGTGRAEGDVYLGFERILGSRGGADVLIGDAGANTLHGFGGADSLVGNGGDDQLSGGAGADRLKGGLGNDAFVFGSAAEGGDLVSDFRGVTGNDDHFELSAEGFGNVLAAGTVDAGRFVTRLSDSRAQDADDHLIFRQDNATLWWDADGKGGAAAVLLADLQAGAVVTAADILMI